MNSLYDYGWGFRLLHLGLTVHAQAQCRTSVLQALLELGVTSKLLG
jgi:hypothetical protein